MIVYFTGTGNSLAAARRLAERTGDRAVPLRAVRPEAADKIAAQITQAYKTAYGDEPTCAVIKPSAGAHLV